MPEMKPRRHRTTCYTQKTWKQAETNTKRCGRSDRATQSSASMSLSPCENSTSVPSPLCPSGGACSQTFPSAAAQFSWTTDAAVLVILPSPPQHPQATLRNHLVTLCQSPAPHFHSPLWISPSYGAAYTSLWRSKYRHTAEICNPYAQGKRETIKPKMEAIGFFILSKRGHRKLLFVVVFLFCLMTCMQRFSMIPLLQLMITFPLLVFKSIPSAFFFDSFYWWRASF